LKPNHWNPDMPRNRQLTGFALIDALAALLLFAVVLLAAMGALLRSMHATHEAVLTGRAVDLAADFLEQRRALPAGAAVAPLADAWIKRLRSELPAGARHVASDLVQPLLAADGVVTP
jgi:Tfp pilus assembly protein PilV